MCQWHKRTLDRFKQSSPIRIQNKCNVPHFTIGWSFLELDTKFVESLTSLLDIVDANGDMTESSTRIRVSIGVSLEIGVRFSPVVVCELEHAFCIGIGFSAKEGDKIRKKTYLREKI